MRGCSQPRGQLVFMRGVARDDTQHEITATTDHVAAPHFRPGRHMILEPGKHRFGLTVQSDQRVERDFVAEQFSVELSVIILDVSGLFQGPHPTQAGRR